MAAHGYETKRKQKHVLPKYPADHPVGMRVPPGGSNCFKCEYVDGKDCKNSKFVAWNGSDVIPLDVNEYCCDFFGIRKDQK